MGELAFLLGLVGRWMLVDAAQDVNSRNICVHVCRMRLCGVCLHVSVHVYTFLWFFWPSCLCTVTAAMTSSWRHVLMVRPPKTAPWWPLAAVSCCLRVRQGVFLLQSRLHNGQIFWTNVLIYIIMRRCVSCSREVVSFSSRALQYPLSTLQGTPVHTAPIPHAFGALPPIPRGPGVQLFFW